MTYFHPSDEPAPGVPHPAYVRRVKLAASQLAREFPTIRVGATILGLQVRRVEADRVAPEYPAPIYGQAEQIVEAAQQGFGTECVDSARTYLRQLEFLINRQVQA